MECKNITRTRLERSEVRCGNTTSYYSELSAIADDSYT